MQLLYQSCFQPNVAFIYNLSKITKGLIVTFRVINEKLLNEYANGDVDADAPSYIDDVDGLRDLFYQRTYGDEELVAKIGERAEKLEVGESFIFEYIDFSYWLGGEYEICEITRMSDDEA